MSADLNNAVHRLRQNTYLDNPDGWRERHMDIEQLSHALGLAESTIDRLVTGLAREVNGPTFMGEPTLECAACHSTIRPSAMTGTTCRCTQTDATLFDAAQEALTLLERLDRWHGATVQLKNAINNAATQPPAPRMVRHAYDRRVMVCTCGATLKDDCTCTRNAPSEPHRLSMQFTLGQAETLLAFFGGSNADMTVEYFPANHWTDSPEAPAGLYVYCTEYPEEGAQWLGREDNSEEIEPTWQHIPAESAMLIVEGEKCRAAIAHVLPQYAVVAWPVAADPLAEVMAEIARATSKFPTWPTDPLHAVAMLGEEFGELTKAVMQATYEPHKNVPGAVREEALQTAAMALRFLASLDHYVYAGSEQHTQTSFGVAPAPGQSA